MKGLVKIASGAVALVIAAGILVLIFSALDLPRGQSAAQAPTPQPVLTPTNSLPLLSNPVVGPVATAVPGATPSIITDHTWPSPARPTFVPLPTSTPLPATGGPFISEGDAIATALTIARAVGTVDESIKPRAVFARASEVPSLVGRPDRKVDSERETWVVFVEGRFPLTSAPKPPPKPVVYTHFYALVDATTGKSDAWGVRNELP